MAVLIFFFFFGVLFIGIFVIALWSIKKNTKLLNEYTLKNGLNYMPKNCPDIIKEFLEYYRINPNTYNASALTDIITGIKDEIKISMFSTPLSSGGYSCIRSGNISGNIDFKRLASSQSESKNEEKEESIVPLSLHNNMTVIKFEGNFALPKFRLKSIWQVPQLLSTFARIDQGEIPDYALQLPGNFGKKFYIDYYEDESVKDLFNDDNSLNMFISQSTKKKRFPIINYSWSFLSLGNCIIVEIMSPLDSSMKIDLLETSLRLLLLLKNQSIYMS